MLTYDHQTRQKRTNHFPPKTDKQATNNLYANSLNDHKKHRIRRTVQTHNPTRLTKQLQRIADGESTILRSDLVRKFMLCLFLMI